MYRILIVEDDAGIAEAVSEQAKMWNFETHSVTNFRNVMAEFAEFDPHLVLMDIGLPFFNGYYWCSEIRKVSRVPVIFISSASDNMNIVMAMNMGGDDFIAKPFNQTVLIAKMQAMLRRTYDFAKIEHVLQCREAVLNVDDHSLTYRGEQIALSRNEYGILKILMENAGKIVSRERLMERLWETDSFIDDNTLTVNVNRLRKKLEGAGLKDFITTKFGVAIARALANDPEIILSDESTSALDPRTTRAILDLLKKVNRELGITIVVITHEMQVIKDICDRVAVMKDGRVVETGTVFDIFANPKEQITREFVENTSNMSRIYELVETKSPVVELKPGEAILRFRYLERNVSEALVSQLSRKFDLDLNIIFGSIELIGENPIGGLVVIAQGTSDNINQAIQYLKDKNVGVEVILDGRTA